MLQQILTIHAAIPTHSEAAYLFSADELLPELLLELLPELPPPALLPPVPEAAVLELFSPLPEAGDSLDDVPEELSGLLLPLASDALSEPLFSCAADGVLGRALRA
jgi:hypothetical protein